MLRGWNAIDKKGKQRILAESANLSIRLWMLESGGLMLVFCTWQATWHQTSVCTYRQVSFRPKILTIGFLFEVLIFFGLTPKKQ